MIIRSHGEWHPRCYSSTNHTKSELEEICKELGFKSGHAKLLKPFEKLRSLHTKLVIDTFNQVKLNNNTSFKLRNSNKPIATVIEDNTIEDCYPVFIECL